ncbi:MAG: hypothetical protein QOF78_2128 [Phycisphaerales bacterium]|jgi:hypothetical protein|nr:hypothetical protein [Phycisphaerales bacterium]
MNGRIIERLESRFCLSSHHGGDFHVGPMNQESGAAHVAPLDHGFTTQQMPAKPERGGRFERQDGAVLIGVILLPPNIILPVYGEPPVTEAPASSTNNNTATTPVQQAATALRTAEVRENRAEPSHAGELLAETDMTTTHGHGIVLATASAPAVRTIAASAGSAIERLTSNWRDGIIVDAADVVQSGLAHVFTPQALAASAVDAATNFFAPAAQAAASIADAVTPVAQAAAYDIVHMGSPFTLLADSLATFIEESAAVPGVVAQADSRGPWMLTAGVIATDVVILTYVYRRKTKLRRAALTPLGVE